MFEKRSEKRSAGTTYDDHDSHRERDSHSGWDSHAGRVRSPQRAGVAVADDMMSTWTGAFYDYAEQLLKAQRQFVHRVLGAGASDADGGGWGDQRDARSDQYHEGFIRSWKDERSNDDDTAEYTKRSIDSDMSGDSTSDPSRTAGANTQTDQSAKTPGRGAASATRKLP